MCCLCNKMKTMTGRLKVVEIMHRNLSENNRKIVWRERKPTRCNNQMFIINFCLNMFRASSCPSSGEQRPCVTACEYCSHPTMQRPTTATDHIQQKQRSTPHAVTHCLCSPEDGHDDARNMLRQKLIINIWLLHLVGFLSPHTLLTMHGHRNLKTGRLLQYRLHDGRLPFFIEID